jgi:putative peptidoglycan lipid II flippase
MEKSKTSENSHVARAAGIVGISTMLSRVFGYIRDIVVTAFFGANWITDAFYVAFRIPNVLRRLLGEGSLTSSFIPVFTEYLQKKSKEEALELANVAFTLLSIILVIVSIAGVILSPAIVTLMAPGFIKTPDHFALTVFLTRLMFPYIFLISLVALCMGILNSFRHFAAPALHPVVLNISMIIAALTLRNFFAEPITALAVGVMVGGILQLAMQWPFLAKFGLKLKFKFNWRHPGIRKIAFLMIPTFIGTAVYQINVIVGTILASLLDSGSVSYLYCADRIMELPLGVFAIAIGTAALPTFSEHAAKGNLAELRTTLSFSLRLMLFVTIPAMIALMALNLPIISVLFQRGAFDAKASILTAQALFYYALGLWAFALIRVIVAAFFSLQDTKWPVKAAVIALIVNVVASIILMQPLKHSGLALANSLASMVNVIVLIIILNKKIGTFLDRNFYHSLLKIIISSLVMWGAILLVGIFIPWNTNGNFKTRLTYLVLAIAVGAITYFVCSYILKSPEINSFIRQLKKRFNR